MPVVGGLLASLSGKRGRADRGRKPALLGLLGAGAAGAAVAKRRKASRSSQGSAIETKPMSEPETASTPAPGPETPAAGDQSG